MHKTIFSEWSYIVLVVEQAKTVDENSHGKNFNYFTVILRRDFLVPNGY